MKGFQQSEGMIPGTKASNADDDTGNEEDIIGVSYSFKRGHFVMPT